MANIHGLGDLGGPEQGEYSALRNNQFRQQNQPFWGQPDEESPDRGAPAGHVPLTRRSIRLPDLGDIFAPWFHYKSVTFALTLIEIAAFLVTCYVGQFMFDGALVKSNPFAGPSTKTLLFMGAKSTPLIRGSYEYWRLISPIFLHGGVLHLASNLFFLSQCSYSFELRWGRWNLLGIFLISGITGDMLSTLGAPDTISVGASGCLFGLLGADLVYLYLNWRHIPSRESNYELCFVSCVLLINTLIGGSTLVDNFAHFGGLVGGAVCGFSLVKMLRPDQDPYKDTYRKGGMIGILIMWCGFFAALYAIP
ncbi:hypothetical protein AAMO2058_001696100 [Amorphochlora amoebiformis]